MVGFFKYCFLFYSKIGRDERKYKIVIPKTLRLFRATCSPPRLLGLVSLVSSFELIYERPALRFYFDDLKQIIAVSFTLSYQT